MYAQKDYEILRSLGAGATSEVFAARPKGGDSDVALKVFSPFVLNDKECVRRLHSEVQVMKSLNHPNIVRLLKENRDAKNFSLELELVEGQHLGHWQKEFSLNLVEPKLWILSQIAKGIGGAHEKGVLHRDLKPENILVSSQGEVKLSDFGLARSISQATMTRSGFLVGSLGYMAPEVINGQRATHQSDLFSFGVLAFELLVGRTPFKSETPQGLIKALIDGKHPSLRKLCPTLPFEVAAIIEQCIRIKPEERPKGIWTIDAVLMNALVSSQLLPFCQQLVGVENRDEALNQALRIKHSLLKQEVEQLKQCGVEQRAERLKWVYLCNQFSELYPDDQASIAELMGLRQEPKPQRSWWAWSLVGIVISLFIGGGIWFSRVANLTIPEIDFRASEKNNFTVSPPQFDHAQPLMNMPPTPPPEARAEKVVEKTKAKAIKAKVKPPTLGRVRFDIDDDVKVTINNKTVGRKQMRSFYLKPGKHLVRLEKPGFQAIENTIDVKAGKVAWVRARTGK